MAEQKPRMLQGVRIIDLTSVVFGPYCTQTLADMGADVIKVEPLDGDQFRKAGAPAKTPGMGPCHMTLNRGKRSAALDLKNPDDAEVMRGLLAGADIFIHNVRAEAIGRLGFGYDEVRAINPEIIYVHCVGFGSDGPYGQLQAYDDVIQAASGMTSLPSRVDGDPRPRYVPSTIADKIAGLHGAYAVLGAYVHKLRTGEGQHVEVPMFEAFTQFLLEEHLYGATFDPPTSAIGYTRQIDPDRQPFPTADGYIAIVPYTDQSWGKLFGLLGDPGFLEREGLTTAVQRFRHSARLYQHVVKLTPARTTAEWSRILAEGSIPAMPARDLNDIMEDPHLKATDFFHRREHPTEGAYFEMRPSVRFSADPNPVIRPAPTIGQHTDELRAELKAKAG